MTFLNFFISILYIILNDCQYTTNVSLNKQTIQEQKCHIDTHKFSSDHTTHQKKRIKFISPVLFQNGEEQIVCRRNCDLTVVGWKLLREKEEGSGPNKKEKKRKEGRNKLRLNGGIHCTSIQMDLVSTQIYTGMYSTMKLASTSTSCHLLSTVIITCN